ncbi:ribosome silencing factor [Weissella muntiaci]|uniref:Ribosomal silencing factor RsfS n=1 Tax=Weissella muntiaci TaxID=2508881 RepID=A0A6C2C8A7_9LACO|nr:ribosome silencing factor [Weissella muntiaci]TYC50174.1 ribosome silencing factor [Weissella muntiaci]
MTLEETIEIAVKAADAKRAENLIALDIHEQSLVADTFLIMEAPTNRQVIAIVDEIEDKLAEAGVTLRHREGRDEAEWVLLDFGDLMVHAFKSDARQFYNLEKLWSDAPETSIDQWLIKEEM